jgi:hypothetical protein
MSDDRQAHNQCWVLMVFVSTPTKLTCPRGGLFLHLHCIVTLIASEISMSEMVRDGLVGNSMPRSVGRRASVDSRAMTMDTIGARRSSFEVPSLASHEKCCTHRSSALEYRKPSLNLFRQCSNSGGMVIA